MKINNFLEKARKCYDKGVEIEIHHANYSSAVNYYHKAKKYYEKHIEQEQSRKARWKRWAKHAWEWVKVDYFLFMRYKRKMKAFFEGLDISISDDNLENMNYGQFSMLGEYTDDSKRARAAAEERERIIKILDSELTFEITKGQFKKLVQRIRRVENE